MQVDVHRNAVADLERLWGRDVRAAATIVALLEQLQADPSTCDKLTTHGDNSVGDALLNVKKWQAARGARADRADLWRFRALNSPATAYRVVYGYHWQTRQVFVLAVVHKDEFDYELDGELAQRILADWRSL